MAGDASAFAVLGLAPDADWSTVDRAYKTLIKANHPDRPGGDARRAAEINRAYRELRDARSRSEPDETPDWIEAEPEPQRRPISTAWFAAAVAIVGGAALIVAFAQPVGGAIDDYRNRTGALQPLAATRARVAERADPLAEPLDVPAISAGVADAARMTRLGTDVAIMQASSACYERLRRRPAAAALDRCVAFDDAIVQLQDRDPLRDDGPFGQLSVTGREMSNGELLSRDYVAIDSRLNRIRLQVELALAPQADDSMQVNIAD